jgi:hypothetical protein
MHYRPETALLGDKNRRKPYDPQQTGGVLWVESQGLD